MPRTTALRLVRSSGQVGGGPFRRGSLFLLGLGSASKGAANRDLVFLSQSWSRCPAEKWVTALLEGVWTRASATLHESEKTSRPYSADLDGKNERNFLSLQGILPI